MSKSAVFIDTIKQALEQMRAALERIIENDAQSDDLETLDLQLIKVADLLEENRFPVAAKACRAANQLVFRIALGGYSADAEILLEALLLIDQLLETIELDAAEDETGFSQLLETIAKNEDIDDAVAGDRSLLPTLRLNYETMLLRLLQCDDPHLELRMMDTLLDEVSSVSADSERLPWHAGRYYLAQFMGKRTRLERDAYIVLRQLNQLLRSMILAVSFDPVLPSALLSACISRMPEGEKWLSEELLEFSKRPKRYHVNAGTLSRLSYCLREDLQGLRENYEQYVRRPTEISLLQLPIEILTRLCPIVDLLGHHILIQLVYQAKNQLKEWSDQGRPPGPSALMDAATVLLLLDSCLRDLWHIPWDAVIADNSEEGWLKEIKLRHIYKEFANSLTNLREQLDMALSNQQMETHRQALAVQMGYLANGISLLHNTCDWEYKLAIAVEQMRDPSLVGEMISLLEYRLLVRAEGREFPTEMFDHGESLLQMLKVDASSQRQPVPSAVSEPTPTPTDSPVETSSAALVTEDDMDELIVIAGDASLAAVVPATPEELAAPKLSVSANGTTAIVGGEQEEDTQQFEQTLLLPAEDLKISDALTRIGENLPLEKTKTVLDDLNQSFEQSLKEAGQELNLTSLNSKPELSALEDEKHRDSMLYLQLCKRAESSNAMWGRDGEATIRQHLAVVFYDIYLKAKEKANEKIVVEYASCWVNWLLDMDHIRIAAKDATLIQDAVELLTQRLENGELLSIDVLNSIYSIWEAEFGGASSDAPEKWFSLQDLN